MGPLRQGDIVTFDFAPSVGHEPTGRRPGLVVSSDDFNIMTSMTLVCPITTRNNGFPLHLVLPVELDEVCGWVALEQVRCYDLVSRSPQVVAHLDAEGSFMRDVLSILRSFY